MKRFLTIAFLFLLPPLHAEWRDHGLTLVGTGPSSLENAVKYELKDGRDRSIYVNSVREPDGPGMKRILKQKDDFFSWKSAGIRELSFFVYEKGLYTVLVPSAVAYRDTDLKPYLPSGFTFVEENSVLNYRYRIIVGSTSLKLDGIYAGEEPMLRELHAFVRGIREGAIVVEDDKVVSGSVVSFSREREKGEMQIHPVAGLPDIGMKDPQGAARDPHKPVISARLAGNYLLPVGDFARAFSGGYGAIAGITLHNTGVSLNDRTLFHLDFGLSTGYWRLVKKADPGDDVNGVVDAAYIIPLIFTARCPFRVWRGFFVAPTAGAGYNYHSLSYEKSTAGMRTSNEVNEWIPSLAIGVEAGYPVYGDGIILLGSFEYMAMFERERNNTAIVFHLGAGYLFQGIAVR